MADSIDVSLGSLQNFASSYKKDIMPQFVNNMDVKDDILFMPDVVIDQRLTAFAADDNIVQPYATGFSSTNNQLLFTPRDLKVYKGKVDVLIVPEELRQTYLSILAPTPGGPGQTMADLPFEAFIMSEIMRKAGSLVNNYTAYFGDNNDTTSTPLAIRIGVGFKRIIAAEITAATIPSGQVYTGGALTNSNTLGVIENVWQSLPEALQNADTEGFVSRSVFNKLIFSLRTSNQYVLPMDAYNQGFIDLPIAAGKCRIKPRTWMNGSNRIIITPRINLVMGADTLQGSIFKLQFAQPNVRQIQCGIDFSVGFQIYNPAWIACNELA